MTVAATQQLSNQQIHHQQQQVFNASNNTYTITKQTHTNTYTLTENHKENNITKTKKRPIPTLKIKITVIYFYDFICMYMLYMFWYQTRTLVVVFTVTHTRTYPQFAFDVCMYECICIGRISSVCYIQQKYLSMYVINIWECHNISIIIRIYIPCRPVVSSTH